MRHGVDKSVVLFVAANLAHQKNGVQNQSGNNDGEKNDAQNEQSDLLQIEQNPADVERDRERDQANAEDDKENRKFSPVHHNHQSNFITANKTLRLCVKQLLAQAQRAQKKNFILSRAF